MDILRQVHKEHHLRRFITHTVYLLSKCRRIRVLNTTNIRMLYRSSLWECHRRPMRQFSKFNKFLNPLYQTVEPPYHLRLHMRASKNAPYPYLKVHKITARVI